MKRRAIATGRTALSACEVTNLRHGDRAICVQPQDVIAFLRRRLYKPILQLMRFGATPQKLAWSIAVGVVIGINPLLGSTTLLALAAAYVLQLNLVASQLGNHLMYPFELLLFPVFIRLGNVLFHTPGLPLSLASIGAEVKQHPWDTTRLLWRWEWHALVVWAGFACAAAPLLQWLLRPLLERMLSGLRDEPTVEK